MVCFEFGLTYLGLSSDINTCLFKHDDSMFWISGPREKLNWSLRYKIVLGTAEGLRYLHEGCQRRIIHKDIKASNILLSEDFEPQVTLMPHKFDYLWNMHLSYVLNR
jgi:serine/threonine protein kinase